MNKIALLAAAVATFAIPAAAFANDTTPMVETAATTAHAVSGHMLYAGTRRLAPVYRVLADGSPQVILDGQLVTVPAATLTDANGKLTTSLTIAQLTR